MIRTFTLILSILATLCVFQFRHTALFFLFEDHCVLFAAFKFTRKQFICFSGNQFGEVYTFEPEPDAVVVIFHADFYEETHGRFTFENGYIQHEAFRQ